MHWETKKFLVTLSGGLELNPGCLSLRYVCISISQQLAWNRGNIVLSTTLFVSLFFSGSC